MADLKMSMAELLALDATFDLETAGRAWGYGRTKSHELVRAGEFPCKVQRLGRRYVITKAALFEGLGIPLEFLFATDPAEVARYWNASPASAA
jgi:hypothetical protein